MRIDEHLWHSGETLFRRRGVALLVFLPLFAWAVWQGEQVELALGDAWGEAFEMLSLALVVAGLALRILTVGFVPPATSGRNTKGQVARSLNTTGMYSVMRNPLYLGNCMIYVGLALLTQTLWVAALLAVTLIPYYERIIAAEERFLIATFGAEYTVWADRTPAFFPRLSGWQPPADRFSPRAALRREAITVYAAVLATYLIAIGLDVASGEPLSDEPAAHVVMGLATLAMATTVALRRWRKSRR